MNRTAAVDAVLPYFNFRTAVESSSFWGAHVLFDAIPCSARHRVASGPDGVGLEMDWNNGHDVASAGASSARG